MTATYSFQHKPIIIMCERPGSVIITLDISTLQDDIGLIQLKLVATFPVLKSQV